MPSAGLLAATLAPEPASALTTELLGSTLRAAARLAAGRAIAAGTVSAAVAALVDQTSRSMSMNSLKFATAVLTAGIIATGAGVFAYQGPGKKQAAAGESIRGRRRPRPHADARSRRRSRPELPGPAPGDGNGTGLAAEPDHRLAGPVPLREAAKILEFRADRLQDLDPNSLIRQPVHSWALRCWRPGATSSDTKANRIAALENYLNVWKEVEKEVKPEDKDELAVVRVLPHSRPSSGWPRPGPARSPGPTGSAPSGRPGPGPGDRPGSDPRSQALLARLEETIPMSFPNPTPLEDVLKYIQQATAGPDGEGIPIYVDPVTGLRALDDRSRNLMKSPITMDLDGVPLRRVLKLIAEQLGMGYGIKDGMVTFTAPDFRRQNWRELLVMEESFPMSSPLELEVERARRGELTPAELDQLNERLKAIEEVTKRAQSIRTMRLGARARRAA